MSNARTIAKNTGWYGLENAINFVVTLFTSIAIARTLGPSKMGYMIYVIWISSIVSSLGGMGIPATTRKYMAEFLGRGDRGTARYIYFRTLLLQTGLATLATAGLLVWIYRDAHAGYLLASALIALSIWPSMVNSISAQANVAAETLSENFPASVISILAFFVSILATVVFNWGVIGFGAATLTMRGTDFLVRVVPTFRKIHSWERSHAHPVGLRARMISFAWQSIASMLLALIVWDRSEFFLLKHLCSDIRQIAYYSVAFSMAGRLLISASVFGSGAGATIFAQYGRDKSRLADIASSSFRYLALTSIPLHFIATSLAVPALLFLYGSRYQGAASVVTLAPLLCLPNAFLGPAQSLLESAERQSYVIAATIVAGVVDIGVAWYLIPSYGAVGACIGSGAAQIMAVCTMWAICISLFKIRLPWSYLAKVIFVSVMASLAGYSIAAWTRPIWGLLFGGSAALIVLIGLIYVLGIFEGEDCDRFTTLTRAMPLSLSKPLNNVLSVLAHRPFNPSNDYAVLPNVPVGEEVMHD